MPEDWITRPEYAALARVSVPTLRRWARDGIGPAPVRIGPRLIRYRRAEVVSWLNSGREAAAS